MTWSIDIAPLLPLPLIIAAGVIAVMLAAIVLLRRQRGAILRTAALALLVFALLDPAIQRENREPLTSIAALVVDRSESQALGDRTAMTDKARAELEKRIGKLRGVELRVVGSRWRCRCLL